ncbi:MAG: hypothetical protein Q4E16_05670 [Neisseria sp.]|nr:hypothetical protein [Neisseria sp.]
MKKLALFCTSITAALSLSGCLATQALDNSIEQSENQRWVATDFNDTIVAIGKPKTPIEGYKNALVLAGQKQNYLVYHESNPDDDSLKNIFETADLRYLRIKLPEKQTHIALKKASAEFACHSSFACVDAMDIELHFYKPDSLYDARDFPKLKKLGFQCRQYAGQPLFCYYLAGKLVLVPTQLASNQANLTHRLKTPIPVVYYEFHADKGSVGRGIKNALIPLAVVFDIVTFPIQAGLVDINK